MNRVYKAKWETRQMRRKGVLDRGHSLWKSSRERKEAACWGQGRSEGW